MEGQGSKFWETENCGSRGSPEIFSEWWWFTEIGQKTWTECEKRGESSEWWKANRCDDGR